MRPLTSYCPPGSSLRDILVPFFDYLNQKLLDEWKYLTEDGQRLMMQEEDDLLTLDETDLTNEILEERTLRNLTRAYADLLDSIFLPTEVKGQRDPSMQPSRRAQIQEYLLTYDDVARPLLMSLAILLTVKDSQSCKFAIITCTRMFPLANRSEFLRDFMGRKLLAASLEALHDSYHEQNQAALISLITDLYVELRELSAAPLETFVTLLGIDSSTTNYFESMLAGGKNIKAKRACVRHLLSTITWIPQDKILKKKATYFPSVSAMSFAGSFTKQTTDMLDRDEEKAGIAELFS